MSEIQTVEQFIMSYAQNNVTGSKEFSQFTSSHYGYLAHKQDGTAVFGTQRIFQGDHLRIYLHPFNAPLYGLSPKHYHNYFEMGYLLRGRATSISDGVETELIAGDLFICNLQSLHQCKTFGTDDYLFNIMIMPSMFDDSFLQMIEGNHLFTSFFMNSIMNVNNENSCMVFHLQPESSLQFFLHKLMVEYLSHPEQKDPVYLQLLLACFFRELGRNYGDKMEQESQQEQKDLSISQVISYLTDHFSTATLQSTAEHFHYTTRFMTGYISRYTNQSFSDIMKELKLRKTCEYILNTDDTFEVIAEKVGYSSSGYLNSVFRKKFGMSMGEYRKYHRGKK